MKPSGDSTGQSGENLVSVGRIGKATGLRGELRLYPYLESDDLSRISCFLVHTRDGKDIELQIAYIRRAGKGALAVKFSGIDCKEQAREIAGLQLLARAGDLPPTGEGEFYAFELVGMEILGPGGEHLGRVEDLTPTPSYFILEAGRLSVPLTEELVGEIDKQRGFLRLKRL
ncbi:MAG: ribosome maturation factor RimM [candidate division WOR-3 bacterium]